MVPRSVRAAVIATGAIPGVDMAFEAALAELTAPPR